MLEVTDTKEGNVVVVGVKGRLDSSTAAILNEQLLGLPHAAAGCGIVLDLSDLEYISSAGMRAVLMLAKMLGAGNGRLAVACLRQQVERVFSLSGLSSRVAIYPSVEEARAAVR